MRQNKLKEKTDRFLEIRSPEKAVGLWSCHADFSTALRPVEPTRATIGKFFNYDLERFETHAEALEMMRAKGWKKTPSHKLKEFAAQYLGEKFDENGKGEWTAVPRWFRAWRSFATWLVDSKTAKPYTDVRLSFGSPMTGFDCSAKRHRTSRVIFLRKNGRKFVAVMMKEGWHGWQIIEKPAYGPEPYERLILSGAKGAVWRTTDADMITELVRDKMMCLFEMEDDAMFDALTDQKTAQRDLGRSRAISSFMSTTPMARENGSTWLGARHSIRADNAVARFGGHDALLQGSEDQGKESFRAASRNRGRSRCILGGHGANNARRGELLSSCDSEIRAIQVWARLAFCAWV